MKRVRDIIFHNLGAQWKGTPSYCDFSGFFSLFFAARNSEAAIGGAEVGGHNMINMTIRELHCTFADFFYKTGIFLCTTTTGRQEYDRMTDRVTERGP